MLDYVRITKSSSELRYKYIVHEIIDFKNPSQDLLGKDIYLEVVSMLLENPAFHPVISG
jgi:hypothetical protein